METEDFSQLPQRDMVEFLTKLNYAILRHPSCFKMAKEIIAFAERYGVYERTATGIDEVLRKLNEKN